MTLPPSRRLFFSFVLPFAFCIHYFAFPLAIHADDSLAQTAEKVNRKIVKLYGSGGFQGLASTGTGVLVSADGFILTVASPLLNTQDLRVHLYDGRRFHAKIVVVEPELDAALVKIDNVEDLPFFDVVQAAKRPLGSAGDNILGFSNEFHIATRDEPVSVMHGVIAAYSKLHGRRGIFDAAYTGEVYVIDAITNNVSAAGGAITDLKGELLGLIGKELRNTLSDTFVNYAVPIQFLASFVEKAKKGEYKVIVKTKPAEGQGGYHGIIMVPNVVERTPPFIDEVIPGSPAAKAGLKPDDLIVYVDGEQMVSVKAFRELLDRARPGTLLKLDVRRVDKEVGGDKLVTVELKLEEQPGVKSAPKKP
jgi:serine protease Do